MAAKSPFEILGISPDALRGRTDEKALRLVELFGKSLLQIEHPDVPGGDEERFKAVQAALGELRNPEAFQKLKCVYLEPRKTKVDRLTDELNQAGVRTRHSRRRREQYQLAIVGALEKPHVLDMTGFKYSLHDYLEFERAGGARFVPETRKSTFFVTLTYKADGTVVQERARKTTQVQRIPLGCIPKLALGQSKGIFSLIKACQPQAGNAVRIAGVGGKTSVPDSKRMLWSHAEPILGRLNPHIVPESYFFSAIQGEEGVQVYFEGNLFRIDPISPSG